MIKQQMFDLSSVNLSRKQNHSSLMFFTTSNLNQHYASLSYSNSLFNERDVNVITSMSSQSSRVDGTSRRQRKKTADSAIKKKKHL